MLERRFGTHGGHDKTHWKIRKGIQWYNKDQQGQGNTFAFIDAFGDVMTGPLENGVDYSIVEDYDLLYVRLRGGSCAEAVKQLRAQCPKPVIIGYSDEAVNDSLDDCKRSYHKHWLYKASKHVDVLTSSFPEKYDRPKHKALGITNWEHCAYGSDVFHWTHWRDIPKKNIVCFDDQTEILTEKGWKSYGEIQRGEFIYSFNPKTEKLEFDIVWNKYVNDYEGKMFSIKSRRTDLLITPNHKVIFRKYKSNKNKYSDFEVEEIKNLYKGTKKIPCAYPIEDKEDNYFIRDNFIKLAGWIISEGNFKKDGRIRIIQSEKKHPQNCKEILDILKSLNFKYYYHPPQIYISVKDSKEIKELGIKNKRIPREWIVYFSKRQLIILLDTLLKGDGSVHPEYINSRRYHSKDKILIDQLQEVVTKLGYKSSIREDKRIGKKCFTLNINIRHDEEIVSRNIKIVDYKGIIWCPSTINGFVITRRNGKVTISGNSGMWHIRSYMRGGVGDRLHTRTFKIMKYLQDKYGVECRFFLNFDGWKLQPQIQEYVNSIGLAVELIEHVPNAEFQTMMAESLIFMEEYQCPNYSRATVVAAAVGTPQVGTDMNTPSNKLFPETTSIHGNWGDYAEKAEKLLTDSNFYNCVLSQSLERSFKYFYYPAFRRRILSLYNKLRIIKK